MSRALVAVGIVAVGAVVAVAIFGALYGTKAGTRTVLVKPCGDGTFGHVSRSSGAPAGG